MCLKLSLMSLFFVMNKKKKSSIGICVNYSQLKHSEENDIIDVWVCIGALGGLAKDINSAALYFQRGC